MKRQIMSSMRHGDPLVRSYAVTHPLGDEALPTVGGWDQIVYTHSGSLTAVTDEATWSLPTQRAMCVGDGIRVRIRTTSPTAVRCLYLAAELGALSSEVRVIGLSPLARELLVHAIDRAPLDLSDSTNAALITVLLDQMARQRPEPLHLPRPIDGPARRLADAIVDHPGEALGELIGGIGAGRRTLERRFRAETGLTLARWQRRARMMAAVQLLTAGHTVTQASALVGYGTPSSFATAFRSELATTPKHYLAEGGGGLSRGAGSPAVRGGRR